MATPFSREGKGRKEERGQRSKNTIFTPIILGLKNGQEVVPPFFGPQNLNFSNPLKPLVFKGFPGKIGGSHFFGKGYVRKRAKQKMIAVWGVFEFDAFLSCVFGFLRKGKEGWGGEPPPKS